MIDQKLMVHTRLQFELTAKIIIAVDLMQRKYKPLTAVPLMILDRKSSRQSYRARLELQ